MTWKVVPSCSSFSVMKFFRSSTSRSGVRTSSILCVKVLVWRRLGAMGALAVCAKEVLRYCEGSVYVFVRGFSACIRLDKNGR